MGWTFQSDVAFLDCGQHVVGNGFHVGGPVFDGQTVDGAEFDLAAVDLVAEHVLQDPLRLLSDRGADPVAADHAHYDGADGTEVQPVGLLLEPLHPLQLFFQHFAEVGFCCLNFLFVRQFSFLLDRFFLAGHLLYVCRR